MAVIICFLVFAMVFCHYMNVLSRDIEETDFSEIEKPADNVIVAHFDREQKRAA